MESCLFWGSVLLDLQLFSERCIYKKGGSLRNHFPWQKFFKCFGVLHKIWNVKHFIYRLPVFLLLPICGQRPLCFIRTKNGTKMGVLVKKKRGHSAALWLLGSGNLYLIWLIFLVSFTCLLLLLQHFRIQIILAWIYLKHILFWCAKFPVYVDILCLKCLNGFVLRRIFNILLLIICPSCPTLLFYFAGLFSWYCCFLSMPEMSNFPYPSTNPRKDGQRTDCSFSKCSL